MKRYVSGKNPIFCHPGPELPPVQNQDYDLDRNLPPLHQTEINHVFDDPDCGDTDRHISSFPKRIRGPDPALPPPELEGWGLEAIHKPSFFKMALVACVAMMLALAVSIVFGWIWLRKHPGDLGGASGLPAAVFGLLSTGFTAMALFQVWLMKG